jgi:hypothetical protein
MADIEIVNEPAPEPKRGPWVNAGGRGRMDCTVRFLKDGVEVGRTHSIPSENERRVREAGRVA